ncbi:hypothetical protein BCR35DRAFT_304786 [Leucosporidium creatinivorum]|uniref:F-box domain-containing protein n=1 Tax=Leucosporidium creatinivorum TaxID=106004 RepID=A0A1Y2F792_9BASI|nr:hypothetical protein BCR35DRAFT_304786 [Leucosporidium creatinivorum]
MALTTTIVSFTTALALDDLPSSKLGIEEHELEVACPTSPAESDCDSDDSSLMSYNSESSSINILPPELVRQILAQVVSGRWETFVVEGQFEEIETQCRSCTYRSLAKVCRDWQAIARELFHRDIVLDKKESAEELVATLRNNPLMASEVRKVDASLRGRNNEMPPLVSVDSSSVVVEAEEREREARSERERELVLQALQHCPFITHLDADFGYHHKLNRPGILPSSIRSLTLRNAESKDTFTLLAGLPCLTDLTLRLVLDWYVDEAEPLPLATNQLSRFELSIVGWGETSTSSINRLLAGSHDSLKSLVLRNKAAVSVGGFLPVARDLIAQWGPQLESLAIKDIPNNGRRAKNEKPLSWFPSKPVPLSNLLRLHLTGLDYDSNLFKSLKAPRLASLTIEDYDTTSGEPLLKALREKELFDGLRELRVSESTSGWKEEREDIEQWCAEKSCRLEASWKLRRLERRWW